MNTATKNMDKAVAAEPVIRAATFADVRELRTLAENIWMRHYPGIITQQQIDYMLAQRYSESALREQIEGDDSWLDLLMLGGGQISGFANYQRTVRADEMKLDKLYLNQDYQGRGWGRLMIEHVCAAATKLDMKTLVLSVAKRNTSSIAVYERNGFVVREEVRIDIGGGFVMDDYVMARAL
jgi:ribosomal protein S18 acetylase RimI-like enzyme